MQYNLFTFVGSVFEQVLFLLIVPTASFTSESVREKANQTVFICPIHSDTTLKSWLTILELCSII